MKSNILAISVFLLSQSLLAETYVCPHELSRFGRGGEIEIYTFTREGNNFKKEWQPSFGESAWTKDILKIELESDEYLVLTQVKDLSGASLTVNLINKKTKEFGGNFITMENFRSERPYNVTYGKCKVIN